jgi:hypothetical protein
MYMPIDIHFCSSKRHVTLWIWSQTSNEICQTHTLPIPDALKTWHGTGMLFRAVLPHGGHLANQYIYFYLIIYLFTYLYKLSQHPPPLSLQSKRSILIHNNWHVLGRARMAVGSCMGVCGKGSGPSEMATRAPDCGRAEIPHRSISGANVRPPPPFGLPKLRGGPC